MAKIETTGDTVVLPPAGAPRPLAIAAAGAIAIGLLTRRRDLVRGGVRLAAVQLTAAAIDAAVHRIEAPGADVATPPPVVIEAVATWLADTLVAAAFDRLDRPRADRPASLTAA